MQIPEHWITRHEHWIIFKCEVQIQAAIILNQTDKDSEEIHKDYWHE